VITLQEQKNNSEFETTTLRIQNNDEWRPKASLDALKVRAEVYQKIRTFFQQRSVLEVDTPLMYPRGAMDPHLQAIPVHYQANPSQPSTTFYLQTSPEYAMKRLLAAGSGSIYQLCKAFREGERGRFHNPEFTMLEWYRVGFNHHDLMDEMADFLKATLEIDSVDRMTYAELFQKNLNLNPHSDSIETLSHAANVLGITVNNANLTRDDWLDLIITHHLEPKMGKERPLLLYDYPMSQAALARIRLDNPPVAERFEVYFRGVELANGYHELLDPDIQLTRFQQDYAMRQMLQKPTMEIDMDLVNALKSGMPACAGVALGVDRLIMLKMQTNNIDDVLAFPT